MEVPGHEYNPDQWRLFVKNEFEAGSTPQRK
jgi:hypothetical protein